MPIYKAFMQTECNSVLAANVFHFEDTVVGSNPDREAELNEYLTNPGPATNFGTFWKNMMSNECKITCTKITKVDPVPIGTQRVFFDELAGTLVQDASPSQLCAVYRIYADLGSKRGRGRHFLMGIPDTHLDGGNYNAMGMSISEQLVQAFYPGDFSPDGSTWRAVVYSKTDDVYRPAVNATLDPIPRNQRNRTSKLCGS